MTPPNNLKMSLLRNELRWALPLAALGLFILVATQLSDGRGGAWMAYDDEWALITVSFFALAAPVLALVTTLVDEVTRTREYLLHRPVSPRRLFWTRQLIALGVLAALIVLAPVVHVGICHLFNLEEELIDHRLFVERVAQGLPAFGIYAVAVFAISCARSLWGAALFGLVAVAATSGLMAIGTILPGSRLPAYAVSVIGTPLLLAGAYRCLRQGRDADRPWDRKRLALAGPLVLLLAGLVGAGSLTGLHFLAATGLYEQYPGVSLDGDRYLLSEWSSDERAYFEVDAQHRRTSHLLTAEPPVVFSPGDGPWDRLEGGYVEFSRFPGTGKWLNDKLVAKSYGGGRWRQAFFVSDGYLYLYRQRGRGSDRQSHAWVRKLGKGPEGHPFSDRARLVSSLYDRVALVHERADGTLWSYDLQGDEAGFSVQTLPGGERFRNAENIRRLSAANLFPGASPLLVESEKNRYLFENGEWKPIPAELAREYSRNPWLKRDIQFQSAGRLSVTLLRQDNGVPVFQHEYRPYTLGERILEVLSETPTLLRSPVTTIASLFREQRDAYHPGPTLLLDPAVTVAPGSRLTVAGNLVVCLLLGGLCFVRLGRLGVGKGRRLFWTAAAVLGGLPGYLCYRLVETDRAWKPVPAPAAVKAAPARLLLA